MKIPMYLQSIIAASAVYRSKVTLQTFSHYKTISRNINSLENSGSFWPQRHPTGVTIQLMVTHGITISGVKFLNPTPEQGYLFPGHKLLPEKFPGVCLCSMKRSTKSSWDFSFEKSFVSKLSLDRNNMKYI